MNIDSFMKGLISRNPGHVEFHQAVYEVASTILPFMKGQAKYKDQNVLERLTEPDRVIMFRVCWEDDMHRVRTNRGYRVQFNNAIGPYKGGLRFDKSVNLSILKFLGFEQTFKNALTTLPMGGGKGGADFNPQGKSQHEIMRFCQAYMSELYKHIGPDVDIPAGDLGCGSREISYLYGQYKRLTHRFTGTITGKGLSFGGSEIRKEATGYGSVYFAQLMLAENKDSVQGKTCCVSGSGNVAQHTVEKLLELGAQVVSMSDRTGMFHDNEGLNKEKLSYIMHLKNEKRGTLEEYCKEYGVEFFPGQTPWSIPCDAAFPSATQNEITKEDAEILVKNGCSLVCEGANMPSTTESVEVFRKAGILFGPSKAANAGGVAVSGLEMTQNSMRLSWTREVLDQKLHEIMQSIHSQCVEYGSGSKGIDYIKGANIAGFIKVSDALMAYGIV